MRVSIEKCKVMHLGANIINRSYLLVGEPLGELRIQKDLEVLVDHRRSNNMQCQTAARKVNRRPIERAVAPSA